MIEWIIQDSGNIFMQNSLLFYHILIASQTSKSGNTFTFNKQNYLPLVLTVRQDF